jgi:hypothetical protein
MPDLSNQNLSALLNENARLFALINRARELENQLKQSTQNFLRVQQKAELEKIDLEIDAIQAKDAQSPKKPLSPMMPSRNFLDIKATTQKAVVSLSKNSRLLAKLPSQARAEVVAEGLPPIVGFAIGLSTSLMGNVVSLRGSGPIPAGLYYMIFTGLARPKPITAKEKSSTIGLQAGCAPKDKRNGRYDINPETGMYELREKPKPGEQPTPFDPNNESVLQVSLRNIFLETKPVGTKYELLTGTNPDAVGNLRFRQVDHDSEDVKAIIYSVNVNQALPLSNEIKENYRLIANHLQDLGKEPSKDSPFAKYNLDALCPAYAQHPGPGEVPQPIVIYGGIVRDCDVDMMTDPDPEAIEKMFGVKADLYPRFTENLEMSTHHHEGDSRETRIAEEKRANAQGAEMLTRILDLNSKSWDVYETMENTARGNPAITDFQKWQIDHAHLKPFIEKVPDSKTLATMVVTLGNGNAFQLWQGLQINYIEQRTLAACLSKDPSEKIIYTDLDDSAKRNVALHKLHNLKSFQYKQATAFIQHPNESNNEFYTSPRGIGVIVSGKQIFIGKDQDASDLILKKNQYVPINKMWIADSSLGNTNAAVWVKHFLAQSQSHYNAESKSNPNQKHATIIHNQVANYLKDPRNLDMLKELIIESKAHPGKGSDSKIFIDKFLLKNPDIAIALGAREAKANFEPLPTRANSGLR